MAVGYCTLYGDMSGGLAVISDVPKQLVYELAGYINRRGGDYSAAHHQQTANRRTTARQCDQDDLPPYDLLDQILQLYLEEGYGRSRLLPGI